MSNLTRALTAMTIARGVVAHPAVQAGLAVAPLLLTPQVRAAAKEATLAGAYKAGVATRHVVNSLRSSK